MFLSLIRAYYHDTSYFVKLKGQTENLNHGIQIHSWTSPIVGTILSTMHTPLLFDVLLD